MGRTLKNLSTTGGIGVLAIFLVASADSALGQQEVEVVYEPVRTSWGTPDISGVWDFRTFIPLERPPELEGKTVFDPEEARAFREQRLARLEVDATRYDSASLEELPEDLRTSLIVDPPNGRLPPLTPQARTEMERRNRDRNPPVRLLFSSTSNTIEDLPRGPEWLGLSERCLVGFNAGPPIHPRAYNNNLRIVQTPDHVVLVTEMIHDARIIPMDGRPHAQKNLTSWSGNSRGRWDGNSLIVETTNFTDKVATFQFIPTLEEPDRVGAAGSGDTMHLTERFTPVAEGRLLYEFTVDDPSTFTNPFTAMIPMKRTDARMFEYACHEGNYAMASMLRGARLEELEAARTVLLE